LNMLYVAFTRAEEELIVYCSKTDSDTINSVSDLIKTSIDLSISEEHTETKHFVAMKSHFDSENLVLSIDDGYKEKDGDKFLREQKIENHFVIDDYPSSEWRDKIAIHYHSDEFFIESIEQIQNRVNHGILMHEIFSKIHTIEDIENALDEIYYTGKIDTFERVALKKSIFEIISLPEIANWFSNEWEIKTETALLTSKGEIRIPDRVIIKNNQAIVIDFKFGDSKAEHVTQVKEYMSYLAEMNFSKVEGFLFYVEQRKTIPVLNN